MILPIVVFLVFLLSVLRPLIPHLHILEFSFIVVIVLFTKPLLNCIDVPTGHVPNFLYPAWQCMEGYHN
jgi:hypothetical protein